LFILSTPLSILGLILLFYLYPRVGRAGIKTTIVNTRNITRDEFDEDYELSGDEEPRETLEDEA